LETVDIIPKCLVLTLETKLVSPTQVLQTLFFYTLSHTKCSCRSKRNNADGDLLKWISRWAFDLGFCSIQKHQNESHRLSTVKVELVNFTTSLCDKVCQWLARDRWFSPGTPVSSTNKIDRHDITEILLKVALNTINPINP
jgi:hypothetical protein